MQALNSKLTAVALLIGWFVLSARQVVRRLGLWFGQYPSCVLSTLSEKQDDLGPMLWFLKYFCRKIWRKYWLFCSKNCFFAKNIGFWEKCQCFRWKLTKIAKNCDHNIDPRFSECPQVDWSDFLIQRFSILKRARLFLLSAVARLTKERTRHPPPKMETIA
jgi:hypothetical protein